MIYEQLACLAANTGFNAYAPLDISTIMLKTEVRDMCIANSCGKYGKNWSCPPGCGTLKECEQNLKKFACGILVQTVGEMEDSYDFEAMMETEAVHRERFKMYAALRKDGTGILALGSGCCSRCRDCTYPAKPCRFPEEMTSSMEAYRLLVSQVCKDNHLPYYYGPNKIAYIGCFLL